MQLFFYLLRHWQIGCQLKQTNYQINCHELQIFKKYCQNLLVISISNFINTPIIIMPQQLQLLYVVSFQVEMIRLQGLEHVLSFTATEDGYIYLKSYKILLKKSGQRTPRIELEEIGKLYLKCINTLSH